MRNLTTRSSVGAGGMGCLRRLFGGPLCLLSRDSDGRHAGEEGKAETLRGSMGRLTPETCQPDLGPDGDPYGHPDDKLGDLLRRRRPIAASAAFSHNTGSFCTLPDPASQTEKAGRHLRRDRPSTRERFRVAPPKARLHNRWSSLRNKSGQSPQRRPRRQTAI